MKDTIHVIRATGIPSYLLSAFTCGRRTAGTLENILAAAFDASVTSMEDEHLADLLLADGSICEVRAKAATSSNAWSTKTSFEGRGANGQGGVSRSNDKWSKTDYFMLVRYEIVGADLLVYTYAIDCKDTERPNSITQKQFQHLLDTLPHTHYTL